MRQTFALCFLWVFLPVLILNGCVEEGRSSGDRPENLTEFNLESAQELTLQFDKNFTLGSYSTVNNIGDVAVDNEGHVYLINNLKRRIEVYDGEGNHLGSIGKAGAGPGEFLNPVSITVLGDSLYARDENLKRMYTFSLDDYELGSSVSLDIAGTLPGDSLEQALPYETHVLSDGSYLAGFQFVKAPDDRRLFYYRLNPSGKLSSDLLLSHANISMYVDEDMPQPVFIILPYEEETLVAAGNDRNLITLHTGELLFRFYDHNGNYLKAWYYPFEKRLLTEGDAVDMFTNVHKRRAIRGADLPATWPAVARFFTDADNRIWVATITSNLDNYRWYVIEASGEPLGWFDLPREEELRDVQGPWMYVKRFNPNRYSDQVVRYKWQGDIEYRTRNNE